MTVQAIVPSYARTDEDLDFLDTCIRTLRETSEDVHVLVVDDAGPLEGAVDRAHKQGAGGVRREENGGFSQAVNEGLREARLKGRDALLVNADVEFAETGWLEALLATDASVVGALLLYPFDRVQHAGVYYSAFTRGWDHRFRFAPTDLEEVHLEKECPVTAALQLIRHECLEAVGIYDPEYPLAFEDVDYCLRVFESGRRCVYQPKAIAVHHESKFRGDGQMSDREFDSWHRLVKQHEDVDKLRWAAPPW